MSALETEQVTMATSTSPRPLCQLDHLLTWPLTGPPLGDCAMGEKRLCPLSKAKIEGSQYRYKLPRSEGPAALYIQPVVVRK